MSTSVAAIADPTAPPRWLACRGCGSLVYAKRFATAHRVCPDCGHHHPLTADERIGQLFDAASVSRVGGAAYTADPLGFTDSRPYPERVAQARAATGLDEAVVCVRGTIEGRPVVAAVMDFRFMGGSLGGAVGELVAEAAESALHDRVPLLLVCASGGARMQEGIVALMQMAKTSGALARLDAAGVLTVSLVTDPTFGGVAASYATLCDVIVTEPGARLGFAGPRVIAQTIRQELPPGFQRAEFLLAHGIVDVVAKRAELRSVLAKLLTAAAPPEPSAADALKPGPPDPLVRDPELLPPRDPWATVRAARAIERPGTLSYFAHLLDDFQELRGDRAHGDCPAIVGGTARFAGRTVVAIGHEKGESLAELATRNYGMATPAGYRKAMRLMRLAAKLRAPVLTFVDTPGAYPGIEAEEQGQCVAIAESIRLMAALPVPIVSVVTGEGGSGGALALAVADRVVMLADAVYSVISPEGCAAILWDDPARAADAAAALRLDARELLALGAVDGVVPVPEGGPQADPARMAADLAAVVGAALDALVPLGGERLMAERLAKFRAFGAPTGAPSTTADTTADTPSDTSPERSPDAPVGAPPHPTAEEQDQ
ncbi:acetyl-CoA carboxylase, carboxyltransferase subunit beta [Streptodolium elevatio]